jgi:uncharacterized membrane protein YkvA (DUF1232 family)
VAPADLIPEAVVGTSGYRDDLVLVALLLHRVSATAPAEALASWRGVRPLGAVLDEVLGQAEELVGATVWGHLQAWVAG